MSEVVVTDTGVSVCISAKYIDLLDTILSEGSTDAPCSALTGPYVCGDTAIGSVEIYPRDEHTLNLVARRMEQVVADYEQALREEED